jgi:hypothetical protein
MATLGGGGGGSEKEDKQKHQWTFNLEEYRSEVPNLVLAKYPFINLYGHGHT